MTRPGRWLARNSWAVLFVVVVSVLTPGTASAQDAIPELEVVDLATNGDQVIVTVVAPTELRSSEVTLGSFVVEMDGGIIPPAVEPVPGDDLDVVLLVDVSGSMAGDPLAAAKTSGAGFINELPDDTRIAVVSFGDDALVLQPFTSSKSLAIETLGGLVADGETALHAAVVTAAQQFDPTSDSVRTIVLLSDGGNTVAKSSLGTAQTALVASGATLHAISIETDESDLEELEALAAASAGTVTSVDQVAAIEALQRATADDLGNQYRLRFTATGEGTQLARIWARSGDEVLAEAMVRLSLPVTPAATEDAPGPTIAPAPVPTAVPTASAPAVTQIEAESNSRLKWISVGAVGLAVALVAVALLYPGQRSLRRKKSAARRSNLRDHDPARGFRWVAGQLADAMEGIMGGRRFGGRIAAMLDAAGWKIRTTEFVVLVMMACVAGFLVGAMRSLSYGAVLALSVFGLVMLFLWLKIRRRRRDFAEQLTGTLQMLAGALRTGYSLPQAISLVAKESEAPASEEFSRVAIELRLGRDLVEAIEAIGHRMKNEDFLWTTSAIDIARDVGGDLSGVLDNVGETIRTRDRIRRQIQSLSAEGRISAWILIVLPFPIFFWQFIVNRDYTLLLVTDPMGQVILTIGVTLLVIGTVWLRRQIRIDY